MGLGWFLIPALAGYWFLTHLHFTRYGVLRESGYHVFFRAAFAGGVLAVLARVIVLFLNHCFPQVNEIWTLCPISIFWYGHIKRHLGVCFAFHRHQFYSQGKAARRTARESGDLIELLISESIEEQKLIEVSLRTGKSYIGFALESGMTRRGEADIALIPVASGHRNKDTQKLEITDNYAPVIQKFLNLEDSSYPPELVIRIFRLPPHIRNRICPCFLF